MPNLIVTIEPEDGWDKKTTYAKLLEKASKERNKIEIESNSTLWWEERPLIKGKTSNLQLIWHYKKYS